MKEDKEILYKGIKTTSISLPIIILAPILLTMGFKGIALEEPLFGNVLFAYALLGVGFIAVIAGMALLTKGIKYILDHLFEK